MVTAQELTNEMPPRSKIPAREIVQMSNQKPIRVVKSSPLKRFASRVVSGARYSPSQQQRFYKSGVRTLKGVQMLYPQIRTPSLPSKSGRYARGRVKQGRGRPTGSYKYYIPGKGNVSVFEYRGYLQQQKQLFKMQLDQQRAMMKVAQRYQNKYAPEIAMQQAQQLTPEQAMIQQQIQQQAVQRQFQRPQYAGQSVMPVEPQPHKEISVLERTPINLGGINLLGNGQTFQPLNETFEETNLMTGNKIVRRRDGGLL